MLGQIWAQQQSPVKRRLQSVQIEELINVSDKHTLVPVVGDVATVVDDREQVPQSVPGDFLVLF